MTPIHPHPDGPIGPPKSTAASAPASTVDPARVTDPSTPARDPLLAWRAEFPILEHTVYMVSHSLGAMPRGVYGELRAFADAWAVRGVRAWGEHSS